MFIYIYIYVYIYTPQIVPNSVGWLRDDPGMGKTKVTKHGADAYFRPKRAQPHLRSTLLDHFYKRIMKAPLHNSIGIQKIGGREKLLAVWILLLIGFLGYYIYIYISLSLYIYIHVEHTNNRTNINKVNIL